MKKEEVVLCQILKQVMREENEQEWDAEIAWEELLALAKKHKVAAMLYDVLAQRQDIPERIRKEVQQSTLEVVQQNYRLFFLARYVMEELKSKGIDSVLLKGASISRFYPVPEYRKSGDVDLLFWNREEAKRAGDILFAMGMKENKISKASHHISYQTVEGIEIELHFLLCEKSDDAGINAYMVEFVRECMQHAKEEIFFGNRCRVLCEEELAVHMLLHMREHFERSGFGLKLLCDWVVFWNRGTLEEEKRKRFLDLLENCRLTGFAQIITQIGISYLGLEREKISFLLPEEADEEKAALFMEDILESGEFGKNDAGRMVLVKGTGIMDYAREFHHQTCLNYPNAEKYPFLLPFYWVAAFCGFVYRNHTQRKISTWELLKRTRKRSQMLKNSGFMEENQTKGVDKKKR